MEERQGEGGASEGGRQKGGKKERGIDRKGKRACEFHSPLLCCYFLSHPVGLWDK